MFTTGALNSFWFGIISAVSLPLGALTIRFWKPRERVVAGLMAFGGGALLAALTIDLVGNALEHGHFYPLAAGCIIGGLFFVTLDWAVNSKGGFLRKPSATYDYLKRMKTRRFKELFGRLARVGVFQGLPPEEVSRFLPVIAEESFADASVIMKQDEPGDRLLIIESGSVEIVDAHRNTVIDTLGAGDVAGEMALVTGEKRSASVVARGRVQGWVIRADDFHRVVNRSAALARAFHELTARRIELLKSANALDEDKAAHWHSKASATLETWMAVPTDEEVRKAGEEHPGAPFAIWLGILLDGIPESLVIGASTVHSAISLSLLAGLFLSNYPEALSSSMGMRRQGVKFGRILLMWGSLTLITGIGAWLGHLFFQTAPGWLFALIEGSAAGAMLTMIAQAMLPEAYRKGGVITGLATLAGFLAAIFFKTLD